MESKFFEWLIIKPIGEPFLINTTPMVSFMIIGMALVIFAMSQRMALVREWLDIKEQKVKTGNPLSEEEKISLRKKAHYLNFLKCIEMAGTGYFVGIPIFLFLCTFESNIQASNFHTITATLLRNFGFFAIFPSSIAISVSYLGYRFWRRPSLDDVLILLLWKIEKFL